MKFAVMILSLALLGTAVLPAAACENKMTSVTVIHNGVYQISWTYQNQCGTTCLFKVETQCCDGGSWRTLVDNYNGTSYSYIPMYSCDGGWRFRVTMVQGCTQSICYIETSCY